MTGMTRHYSGAASQARHAADKAADVWTQGARGVTGLIPRLPQIDLIPAVEGYFDVVQLTVDVSRYLAVKWVQAAGTLTGVARDQAESGADVVREMPASVGHAVHEQAAKAEQAVREQAEKAEQERARRPARPSASRPGRPGERYEGLTKAELSNQLAERNLPKTGTVDELTQRLIEDDQARERYEGLTKAELSDQLAERNLPKTGTVDELTERLIEADSK